VWCEQVASLKVNIKSDWKLTQTRWKQLQDNLHGLQVRLDALAEKQAAESAQASLMCRCCAPGGHTRVGLDASKRIVCGPHHAFGLLSHFIVQATICGAEWALCASVARQSAEEMQAWARPSKQCWASMQGSDPSVGALREELQKGLQALQERLGGLPDKDAIASLQVLTWWQAYVILSAGQHTLNDVPSKGHGTPPPTLCATSLRRPPTKRLTKCRRSRPKFLRLSRECKHPSARSQPAPRRPRWDYRWGSGYGGVLRVAICLLGGRMSVCVWGGGGTPPLGANSVQEQLHLWARTQRWHLAAAMPSGVEAWPALEAARGHV
jgi:hypothetical protein